MKKIRKSALVQGLLVTALSSCVFLSCKKDNVDVEEPNATLSVFSYIENFAYLNTLSDPTTGTISVKGNGLELNTFGVGATQVGDYYYVWNSAESTIDQYKPSGTSFTKVTSIAVPPLLPDERPRVMRPTDDGNLLINSWPDSEKNVYYALISLPNFTLLKKGSLKLNSIGVYGAGEAEFIVSGNKAYLGTSYFNKAYTAYPDSVITWVYDYPSFTNGKMVVSKGISGNNGGYVGFSNVKDEKGDIYQAPINSKHWSYNNEDAYILKLTNGQYDESYKFNLTTALGKKIGMWSLIYAENGIAYAKVVENDANYSWGLLRSSNTVSLVKIDLYKKTAIEIGLSKFMGFYLQNGVVDKGKFYLPVSFLNGETNVYIFDINGGVNSFTKGAKLDGDNIISSSMFKH
jgi:hypothetical protein